MDELKARLELIEKRVHQLAQKLNLEDKRKTLRENEALSLKEDFWSDNLNAQKVMREIDGIRLEISSIEKTESRLQTAKELVSLVKNQPVTGNADPNTVLLVEELHKEIRSIEADIEKLEVASFLSGPYDAGNAILAIHAGQGGTEAMDWVSMLLRMYLSFSETMHWKTEILD